MTTLARDEPRVWGAASEQVMAPAAVTAAERLAEVAPMVRRMCVARLGPWDGEDAAQEVLVRLWRCQQRPEYSAEAPLFGWAAANVRFQVLANARQRGNGRAVPAGELAEQLWIDPQAGPEEQAERRAAAREAQTRMRELIPRLSRRERQVILASGFGTRSNAETGARLGISRAAVSVAKQNAIARMRELVGVTAPGTRVQQRAAAYRARLERRQAQRPAAGAAVGWWPRGVPLPGEVHQAGRAAAGAGWSSEQLTREFGVGAETIRRWRGAARAPGDAEGSARSHLPLPELIARAHEARATAGDRAAAASARAAQRTATATAGGGWGRAWPDAVHHAGRAAVRDGWTNHDLVRELGVSTDVVTRWRQTDCSDGDAAGGLGGGSVSTAELIARAHRVLAAAARRREEVEVCARQYGRARRGRGQSVPDTVARKAREAARSGWTSTELEHGFGISRGTARRWIREQTQTPARDTEEHRSGPDEGRADEDSRGAADGLVAAGARAGPARDGTGTPGEDSRVEDPLERARRAVAALPSPAQARAAADERDLAVRARVDALGDLAESDAECDALAGVLDHHDSDQAGDAWSAA